MAKITERPGSRYAYAALRDTIERIYARVKKEEQSKYEQEITFFFHGWNSYAECGLRLEKTNFLGGGTHTTILSLLLQNNNIFCSVYLKSIEDFVKEELEKYAELVKLNTIEIVKEYLVYTPEKAEAREEKGILSLSSGGGELSEAPQSGELALSEAEKKSP